MTKAKAIANWEVGLPQLSALHPCPAKMTMQTHPRLTQGIEGALIGMRAQSAA